MKDAVKLFVDFYLYSSLHISIAAALLTVESFLIFDIPINVMYVVMVFWSTLLTYSIHRIVGLKKLKGQENQGRFIVIRKYAHHIRFYAVLSFIGIGVSAYFIESIYLTFLIPAAIISTLYTFPILSKGRRLRDFNYIKIFLIASVWSYICGIIPALRDVNTPTPALMLGGLEKFIFFIAITIPFDIRDYEIDKVNNTKTLTHLLGIRRSWQAAFLFLFAGLVAGITLSCFLERLSGWTMLLIYLVAAGVFILVKNKSSDYYYSGVTDGLILIRSLMVIFFFLFSQ